MPLNFDLLQSARMPDVKVRITQRDSMLYALGIGFGHDPTDENQLRFVYEKNLQVAPCMAIVLGSSASHLYRLEGVNITRTHVVHGEQGFELMEPLPVDRDLVGENAVTKILDKGKDKGAVVQVKTTLRDVESKRVVATATSAIFARADGGFGGPSGPADPLQEIPSTSPAAVCDLPTFANAALVYRLSGDYNPLHAEPAFAKRAGFSRPILHGRCTYGVACHAILKECCGYDAARLSSMYARFSAPVYPGDVIRTEMWQDGKVVTFRSSVPERNAVVINNGRAVLK